MIEPLLHAERLLLMGLLDQAEAIYRRIAEQDPRNAIAVMGLARVAVERGEMEEAHAQAARALRIDPENAAASAMATRTAELLARPLGIPGSREESGSAVPGPGGAVEPAGVGAVEPAGAGRVEPAGAGRVEPAGGAGQADDRPEPARSQRVSGPRDLLRRLLDR